MENESREPCNMAEAATGDENADAAKCAKCGQELDGSEPHDDPYVEHIRHIFKSANAEIRRMTELSASITARVLCEIENVNNEVIQVCKEGQEILES